MAQEKPEHHRKRRQLVWMIVSLLLAAAVIASAIWLRSNRYFYSSESHSLEAFRGLEGKGEVQTPDVSVTEDDRWVLLSTLDYADEKSENGTPSMLLLKLQPA